MNGWIRLHRRLLDNPIFKNHKLLQTFLYCLLKASHQEREQLVGDSIVSLNQGELATGRKAISKATGLTEQNVRTALMKLEMLNILTIKKTPKYSVITVLNWDCYQQTNQQVTNCQPTSNQQVTTNNNYKNYKKEEKDKEPGGSNRLPPVPYQKIIDLYHEKTKFPRVEILSETRKKHLRARWKEPLLCDLESWANYFDYVATNNFLNGRNDRSWKADFDFLIKPDTAIKCQEGKYDERI